MFNNISKANLDLQFYNFPPSQSTIYIFVMPKHLSTNLQHFPKKYCNSILDIELNLQSTFNWPSPIYVFILINYWHTIWWVPVWSLVEQFSSFQQFGLLSFYDDFNRQLSFQIETQATEILESKLELKAEVESMQLNKTIEIETKNGDNTKEFEQVIS